MENTCTKLAVLFEKEEQFVELGQASTLTMGVYGAYIEGYHRFFDYYPYEN